MIKILLEQRYVYCILCQAETMHIIEGTSQKCSLCNTVSTVGSEKMAYERKKKKDEKEETKGEFKVVGWIGFNKKETTLIAKTAEGELIGFILPKTMDKLLSKEVDGCPIKLPEKEK